MPSLKSMSDIGLYDPNINAYKFAIAFNDNNMISPISGVYKIRFISTWGQSVTSLKCGTIKIDFGIKIKVYPSISQGKMHPEIDYINPIKPSASSLFCHLLYIGVIIVVVLPFLKMILKQYTHQNKTIKKFSIVVIVIMGSLMFFGILYVSHFYDKVVEFIPILILILFGQAYLYNKMLTKI